MTRYAEPGPWGDPELRWPSEAVPNQSKGLKRLYPCIDQSVNPGSPWRGAQSWGTMPSGRGQFQGRDHRQPTFPAAPGVVLWSSAGDLWGSPQHPRQPTPCSAGTHLLHPVSPPIQGQFFQNSGWSLFPIKTQRKMASGLNDSDYCRCHDSWSWGCN